MEICQAFPLRVNIKKKMWDSILNNVLINIPTSKQQKCKKFPTLYSTKTWISFLWLTEIPNSRCSSKFLFTLNVYSHLDYVKFFIYNIPCGISEPKTKLMMETLVIVLDTLWCVCYNLLRPKCWETFWFICKRILNKQDPDLFNSRSYSPSQSNNLYIPCHYFFFPLSPPIPQLYFILTFWNLSSSFYNWCHWLGTSLKVTMT